MKPHAAIAMMLLIGASAPPGPPTRVGTCAFTTIRSVGQRLEDGAGRPVPDSGASIMLANRVYGVSYEQVAAVQHSRVGDRVMTCLAKLPTHCPPGDQRGRWYTTTICGPMSRGRCPMRSTCAAAFDCGIRHRSASRRSRSARR